MAEAVCSPTFQHLFECASNSARQTVYAGHSFCMQGPMQDACVSGALGPARHLVHERIPQSRKGPNLADPCKSRDWQRIVRNGPSLAARRLHKSTQACPGALGTATVRLTHADLTSTHRALTRLDLHSSPFGTHRATAVPAAITHISSLPLRPV